MAGVDLKVEKLLEVVKDHPNIYKSDVKKGRRRGRGVMS